MWVNINPLNWEQPWTFVLTSEPQKAPGSRAAVVKHGKTFCPAQILAINYHMHRTGISWQSEEPQIWISKHPHCLRPISALSWLVLPLRPSHAFCQCFYDASRMLSLRACWSCASLCASSLISYLPVCFPFCFRSKSLPYLTRSDPL